MKTKTQEQICQTIINEKTGEICGHKNWEHFVECCHVIKKFTEKSLNREYCPCKKFTPKNHSPQDSYSKNTSKVCMEDTPSDKVSSDTLCLPEGTQNQEIPERAIKGMLSAMEDVKKGDYITLEKGTPQNQEKGCGNDFIDDEGNERMCGKSNNYGQMFYCEECQEKEK